MSLRILAVLFLCAVTGAFSPVSQAQRPLRVEDVRAPIVLVDLPGSAPTRTGLIVDPSGYVVVAHDGIVEGAPLVVRLRDGRSFPAKLAGLDTATHTALLKVEALGLPTPRIGDPGALKPGDAVVGMGYEGPPARGLLVGKDRKLSPESPVSYLESNLASSDRPVFNLEGELVGLTRLHSTNDNRSLAVPIDQVMRIVQRLRGQ